MRLFDHGKHHEIDEEGNYCKKCGRLLAGLPQEFWKKEVCSYASSPTSSLDENWFNELRQKWFSRITKGSTEV